MEGKSVGLKILCFAEVIISLRVLLFSIPVMISRNSAGVFSMTNLDDRFMAVLSLTAILYCLAGSMAIAGSKLWKAAHYLAVVFVALATLATVKVAGAPLSSFDSYYALPLLFAVIFTVLTGVLGRAKKTA
jgi:hypothetical protein